MILAAYLAPTTTTSVTVARSRPRRERYV